MSSIGFTEAMARTILENELSSHRFERFCVALFSEVDGVEYVPTSASWDLGRDGRSVSARDDPALAVICCSLRDDVDEKARRDV